MAPARPTRSSRRGSPKRPTTSRCAPSRSASASAVRKQPAPPSLPGQPIYEPEAGALFAPLSPFATLIVAVSGGADSMALLHLVARWAQRHPRKGRKILVATVDHSLRPGSRAEAERVGEVSRGLGLEHQILTWQGPKPATGVQEAAREARYRLLSELARAHGSKGTVGVLTAHTEDDQAETFLMRLARGSGLDGLAAISASRPLDGEPACQLVRPLLAVSGARLKATLQGAGLSWIDDPSNDSDRFERVRLRGAKDALVALGLSPEALALSAKRLARARAALEHTAGALQDAARLDLHGGAYASLEAGAFLAAPEEVRLRLLARLLTAFGGRSEPVRLAKLESLLERMENPAFPATTLGGAMVVRRAKEIIVHREPGRAARPEIALAPGNSAEWDGRFRVSVDASFPTPLIVAPLGRAGFARLRQQLERAPRLPARAAATLPAFWQEGRLIAVPTLAGLPWSSAVWSNEARLCRAEFLW